MPGLHVAVSPACPPLQPSQLRPRPLSLLRCCTSAAVCRHTHHVQSEARHLALSDLDHRVVILFFCFDIFNTFLGSVLGGAVFQQIGSLTKEPGAAARL